MSKEEDVTILIPVYNAKKSIKETIESIKKQKYSGNIYINIIDDGSTDDSIELLKSMELDSKITLLRLDTVLHPLAVRNIMQKLVNSDKKVAAIAGCLFIKNNRKNFISFWKSITNYIFT